MTWQWDPHVRKKNEKKNKENDTEKRRIGSSSVRRIKIR
jgi:hypothetical protein